MGALQQAIERELAGLTPQDLSRARGDLSARYQVAHQVTPYMGSSWERLSYLATRMPATFAAVCSALKRMLERLPEAEVQIETLLDLGSGPGTALWAAVELLQTLREATLCERDGQLIQLGQRLLSHEPSFERLRVTWQQQNLAVGAKLPQADLVMASYVLGELPEAEWQAIAMEAWRVTGRFLLFVEPGTPAGFLRIRQLRKRMLEEGAYIVAPCTHCEGCPMSESDWCHFAAPVARSSLHRQLKQGTLGHEEEKYSYVVFSKEPISYGGYRIVHSPQKRSGHVHVTLCGAEGLVTTVVSKRHKEVYQQVRRADWGDRVEILP